ncbi:MAG: hypothetical protein WCX73_05375, partial [Candidatus Pacearchaeota archaeon]
MTEKESLTFWEWVQFISSAILIIVSIILLVVLFFFLCLVLLEIIISFANFITPVDYKITINECHNETNRIGSILVNQTTSGCGYTKYISGCMECEKGCISEEEFNSRCPNSTECHLYINGFDEVYKREIYMTITKNWKDITNTTEVCEDKEVDEIEYYESNNLIVNLSDGFLNNCILGDSKPGLISCSNYDINFSVALDCKSPPICSVYKVYPNKVIINKSEVTEGWLDDNCECFYINYIN